MEKILTAKRIAIIGSGPSGLFLLKNLLNSSDRNYIVDIFEGGNNTGSGFPYSREGSCYEHITNVSGNEIPSLVSGTAEWLKTLPASTLHKYGIDPTDFTGYQVFPRLLFGEYLHAQFELLLQQATEKNITVHLHLNSRVTDIIDDKQQELVAIEVGTKKYTGFNHVIICSGHQWPKIHEGTQPGYYDSPYPPVKIARHFNHPIAIKGSSLTAIDAIRTLAQHNGQFSRDTNNKLIFTVNEKSKDFSIVMYSLQGLLPGIRFHLEDSHLSADSLLSDKEIECHRAENDGFLSLDFIFEKDFKEPLRVKDPAFYNHIRDMSMEAFVDEMMSRRERAEPFSLFRAEYEEARRSIQKRKSVHWKEMLAVLSFAMNYPAKHFSAEDMQRLQQTLMPLISIIIAFVPQDSCEELFALHNAGKLSVIPVEKNSRVEPAPGGGAVYHHTDEEGRTYETMYQTFINCTGQPHLWIKDFPFSTLVRNETVKQALLRFQSVEKACALKKEHAENIEEHPTGKYFLKVPGLAISDNFNVIGKDQLPNPRIYIMAVPFIGGYNPDYSGLDFCEEASGKIVQDFFGQSSP
ncbi:MAG: FAD/NAD(P)-binding protein [Bacteroidota bacterium]